MSREVERISVGNMKCPGCGYYFQIAEVNGTRQCPRCDWEDEERVRPPNKKRRKGFGVKPTILMLAPFLLTVMVTVWAISAEGGVHSITYGPTILIVVDEGDRVDVRRLLNLGSLCLAQEGVGIRYEVYETVKQEAADHYLTQATPRERGVLVRCKEEP